MPYDTERVGGKTGINQADISKIETENANLELSILTDGIDMVIQLGFVPKRVR